MNKRIALAVLCGSFLLTGAFGALTLCHAGRSESAAPPPVMRGEAGHGPMGHWMLLLDRLDLSEEQQQAVDKLLAADREQAKSLHGEMAKIHHELCRAMESNDFDEKSLRRLAKEEGRMRTELLVGQVRTRSRIYALLTPEQKELADLARNLKRLQGMERHPEVGGPGFHRPNFPPSEGRS